MSGAGDEWVKLFEGRAEVSADLASAFALLEKHAILRADGVDEQHGDEQLKRGDQQLLLRLHLTNALQACAKADDQPPPRRHLARALHTLMGSLFGAAAGLSCGWQLPSHSTLSLEPSALYAALEEHTTSASRPTVPLPPLPALRPTLKPHQRDAVGWMLGRERADIRAAVPGVECTWRRVRCADGRTTLHWNACSGALATQLPPAAPGDVSGGVLADEMGLGKTVDVLALLLANRWTAPEDEAQAGAQGEAQAGAQAEARPALRCPRGHALQRGAATGPLWCDLCSGAVARVSSP